MDIEKVAKFHAEGLNCAQVVLYHGAEKLGIKPEDILKTAACFGGGMQAASSCGCLTGGLMALGLKYGNSKPGEHEEKMLANQKAKEFRRLFFEKAGTIDCKDILRHDVTTPEGKACIAELGLSKSVCEPLMKTACELLDKLM